MSYDNNLTGVLFRNDKKETEKHPDYRGQCEVEGTKYWLSAWINKSKDGEKYMSLKLKAKDDAPKKDNPAPADDDFSDEVPF